MLNSLINILYTEKILFTSKILSSNISLTFKTSFVSNCFVLMIIFLYSLTAIYSIGYLNFERDKRKIRFHILMFIASLITICLAYADNLFTAFIFYDLLSVCTYMLVKHHSDNESEKNALMYLFYLILPSMLLLLPAIIAVYIVAGNTTFTTGGIFTNIPLSSNTINILFLLFVYGISKTALYPLHKWLIHAMVAPSPVSALLHAVLVVKSGLFLMYKVITEIFGLEILQQNIYKLWNIYWPVYIAGISIIFAGMSAINSKNIKQRLAYSTISQIGYISMCLFCFSQKAIIAAQLQFLSHSFAKISLFFYAGYLLSRYAVKNVDELRFRKNHFNIFMSIVWLVPVLSLMSMPLTFGFISKHAITSSIILQLQDIGILLVIVIGIILCILYLYPILYHLITFNTNDSRFDVKNIQIFPTLCIYIPTTIISLLIIFGFMVYLS